MITKINEFKEYKERQALLLPVNEGFFDFLKKPLDKQIQFAKNLISQVKQKNPKVGEGKEQEFNQLEAKFNAIKGKDEAELQPEEKKTANIFKGVLNHIINNKDVKYAIDWVKGVVKQLSSYGTENTAMASFGGATESVKNDTKVVESTVKPRVRTTVRRIKK